MRRRWWGARRIGRWHLSYDLTSINLPRVHLGADGDHGDEYESRYVALSYGTSGADAVVHVEVDLTGTPAGWLLAETVWFFRERRWRGGAVGESTQEAVRGGEPGPEASGDRGGDGDAGVGQG